MKKNCYLCNKKTSQKIVNLKIRGNVNCKVYRCLKCELEYLEKKFVKKFLTSSFYRKEYVKLYDPNFFRNKNNHYAKIYEKINKFTKNKNVLEIGAGGGYLYHYLKKNVKKYEAVELSNLQRNYLKKKFKIKTYSEIDHAPTNSYDIVIIISVLEHVLDPIHFLKSLKKLLKKNGKVIIECPSINDPLVKLYDVKLYKNFYYRPVHLNYFNMKHLKKIASKSGFNVRAAFSVLVYSLKNHLKWFFKFEGSKDSNEATNNHFSNKKLETLFNELNTVYFSNLSKKNFADMEILVCEKK